MEKTVLENLKEIDKLNVAITAMVNKINANDCDVAEYLLQKQSDIIYDVMEAVQNEVSK